MNLFIKFLSCMVVNAAGRITNTQLLEMLGYQTACDQCETECRSCEPCLPCFENWDGPGPNGLGCDQECTECANSCDTCTACLKDECILYPKERVI